MRKVWNTEVSSWLGNLLNVCLLGWAKDNGDVLSLEKWAGSFYFINDADTKKSSSGKTVQKYFSKTTIKLQERCK